MDNSTPSAASPSMDSSSGETLSITGLVGMPVVLLSTGEKQGDVDKVFVSSTEHRLIGLTVHRPGGMLSRGDTFMLRSADVRSFGKDAITIEDASALQKSDRDAAVFVQEAGEPAMGKNVMTQSGKAVGHVADIMVDKGSLNVAIYEVSGSFLQNLSKGLLDVVAEHVVSIGKDVVVIRDIV